MTQTGAPVTPCAACGEPLPARARFCSGCGAPVVPVPAREVRKTVTLLFTDVTGSTALGERLDPEALRVVMGRYFDAARTAVERHGGTVEKFVGDAVLAVFGVPEVREDDALRAVRAAHDLVVDVAALGLGIALRTAVNTGPVVVGSARAGGSFATGDAVNTAARLEQAAGPGEVLLGESTYALVRDAVTVAEVEPVRAKGKAEPVRAYRLLELSGADGRHRHLDAALVGREVETRALDDALSRTVASGRGHLVTVTGAPGVGKTRLVSAFAADVGERALLLSGRCVSYGEGITYWPVIQLLRQAAGLDGGEPVELARRALLRLVGDGPEDRDAVDRLLPLLGLGGSSASGPETAWAVCHALGRLAERRPVVVSVDDLHWAEPTLVELLQLVREETRDLPLLMVCTARPELLGNHPEWGQGSTNASVFGLEPFDAAETGASLAALLGGEVPVDVVDAVAGWSGGNPLFVEEIATHLVERGVLVRGDDGWRLAGELSAAGVPATVSALLSARLDRLPAAERTVLERASVIGLEFTAAEAALLDGAGDVLPVLAALARRDLLRRVRGGRDLWAFRHVIVRDAAYDALSLAERVELHSRFAAHLEAHGGFAGAEHRAFVAHHLARAATYAERLEPGSTSSHARADAAVSAAIAAARDARNREDLDGARALACEVTGLGAGPRLRRDLALAVQLVEQARYDAEGEERAMALLDAALADLEPAVSELDRAHRYSSRLAWQSRASQPEVTPEVQLAAALRVVELARAAGDAVCEVVALRHVVDAHLLVGHWGRVVPAIDRIEVVGDGHDRAEAQMWRCGQLMYGAGTMAELQAYAEARLAEARSHQLRLALRGIAAGAALCRGERGAGHALAEVALAINSETANEEARLLVVTLLGTGGRSAEARDRLVVEVEAMRAHGSLGYLSTYLAWLALLEVESGADPLSVEAMFEEAERYTSEHDVHSIALGALGRALVAARHGDHLQVAEQTGIALEACDSSDNLWMQAELRRWLAPALVDHDPVTARRLSAEAAAVYAAKGIVTWLGMLGA